MCDWRGRVWNLGPSRIHNCPLETDIPKSNIHYWQGMLSQHATQKVDFSDLQKSQNRGAPKSTTPAPQASRPRAVDAILIRPVLGPGRQEHPANLRVALFVRIIQRRVASVVLLVIGVDDVSVIPQEVAHRRHLAAEGGVEDVIASERRPRGTRWVSEGFGRRREGLTLWLVLLAPTTNRTKPVHGKSSTVSPHFNHTDNYNSPAESCENMWQQQIPNTLAFRKCKIWPGVQRDLGSPSERSALCSCLFIFRLLVCVILSLQNMMKNMEK